MPSSASGSRQRRPKAPLVLAPARAAGTTSRQAGHHGLMRREIGSTTSTGAPSLAASLHALEQPLAVRRSDSSFAVNAATSPRRASTARSASRVARASRGRERRAVERPARLGHGPAVRVDAGRRSPAAAARAPTPRPRCRCRSRGRGSAAAARAERAHDLAHQQEVQRAVVERECRALAAALERLAEC